jgi:hypothetical protein
MATKKKTKTTRKPPIVLPAEKPKRNGKRQQMIPGTEPSVIPELEDAAGWYVTALYARQRLQREEDQHRAALVEKMRELKQDTYTYEDGDGVYLIKLESKEKIICRKQKDTAAVEIDVGVA